MDGHSGVQIILQPRERLLDCWGKKKKELLQLSLLLLQYWHSRVMLGQMTLHI